MALINDPLLWLKDGDLASGASAASGDSTGVLNVPLVQLLANDRNLDLLKAPLLSPDLTGTPTAPTAPLGTSSAQIASTEFVTQGVGVKFPVITLNITDGAVTTAKLAGDPAIPAVSTAKIQGNAVTTGKIAAGAVTTSKILDAAITALKLSATPPTTNGKVLGWVDGNLAWVSQYGPAMNEYFTPGTVTLEGQPNAVYDFQIRGSGGSAGSTAPAPNRTRDGTAHGGLGGASIALTGSIRANADGQIIVTVGALGQAVIIANSNSTRVITVFPAGNGGNGYYTQRDNDHNWVWDAHGGATGAAGAFSISGISVYSLDPSVLPGFGLSGQVNLSDGGVGGVGTAGAVVLFS